MSFNCSLGYVETALNEENYSSHQSLDVYAAMNEDSEVMAIALLNCDYKYNYAILRLAVTFTGHRNKGIYNEMVRARLAKAKANGIDLIITHALKSSQNKLEVIRL